MKIVLAQLNYHIGNFDYNVNKIIEAIEKAQQQKADLVIFSELSVCGYTPLDLFEQKEFIEKCEVAVNTIALHCTKIAAIVGAPSINKSSIGKKLYNSAYFIAEGKIQSIHHKTLLPTYDVFDEYRHFEANREFQLIHYKGEKIAITICEDLWFDQPVDNSFEKNTLYILSPLEELSKLNPDFVVNLSASPFSYRQMDFREQILKDNATKYKLPILYVNQVGANTELVFDGDSKVINANGEIIKNLNQFQEDFDYIDSSTFNTLAENEKLKNEVIASIHDALVLGISDYFKKMNFTDAVLGLSGGIDSAVVLALTVKALGDNHVRVLLLPSKYSSNHSIDDAIKLANNLKVKYDIVPIQPIVDAFGCSTEPIFLNSSFGIAEENIQARVRGTLLMAISNKFGNILLNTTNKSEAAVGYGTLYGDMNGGLSVLGDVYKTEVYKLANYINKKTEIIPINTIIKPPSAELKPDQKDTDSLPDYAVLDDLLYHYIELKHGVNQLIVDGFDKLLVEKIIRLVNANEYKRFQFAPVIRISSKSFGFGRRMPLVAKY